MKRIMPFVGALILFLCTCLGLHIYCIEGISNNQVSLIYYNTDSRNSSQTAMKKVLGESSIPVFGSSELSAADELAYPPSLFHHGNSDFNMILIGRGSMQSLHHAISLGALEKDIPNRKAVLILSPQWFTQSHLSSESYASRFSERMYVEFMKNKKISYETKLQISERAKSLMSTDMKQLERICKYEEIYLKHSFNPILYAEMGIYNCFMNLKQDFSLNQAIRELPLSEEDTVQISSLDFSSLLPRAEEIGKEACTNNDFYIYDEYYDTYVRDVLESSKDSKTDASYQVSPEYDDLKLFLDVCKEAGISPLIISIPVNGFWYDWTGFPKDDREAYYQNIRNICDEYQVQLADFSDKEYEPYFLKDIMHLGWKGWVYLDAKVYEFFKQDME